MVSAKGFLGLLRAGGDRRPISWVAGALLAVGGGIGGKGMVSG
jgi:hypothetical protein